MIGPLGLVAAWTLGAALHTPPLSLHGDLAPPVVALHHGHGPLADGDGTPRLFVAQHPTPPATPATPAEPEATETTGGGAAAEACDVDCETAHEDAVLARYVMRNRARTLRTHRAFAIATWATMLVTEALGTIQTINQPTWFGDGACSSNPEAFGCHQSSMITGLHETFAITTTALYTTTALLAIAAPDPENASSGEGTAQSTLRLHRALAWVHGAGMILLPFLGVLAAHPQILGISQSAQGDFSRAMRTVHAVVGGTTFVALSIAGYVELF